MSEAEAGERRPGGALGVIFGIVLLDLIGFGIVIPQLGIYAVRFEASPFVVGLLLATYSVFQLIGAPVLGSLSDRYGRRPVLLISLAGSLAGYLLFAFAHSLTLLFVSRIIHGLAGGNIATAQAYVSDVTRPEERARGMGIIGAAFGLGFVLGPAIGGVLGAFAGNLGIGLGASLLAAVDLVLAYFILAESKRPGAASAHPERLSALKASLARGEVGGLLVVFLVFITAFALMEGTFSIFLLARHVPGGMVVEGMTRASLVGAEGVAREASWRAAILFTVVGVVSAVIQGGLIGRLKERFGEPLLARAGITVTGLGLLAIPLAPSFAWLFVPMVLLAAGSALTNPSLSTLVSLRAREGHQGEALGAYQAMGSLGRILGPALGGAIFNWRGSAAPYWVAALMMGLTLALAVRATARSP